ncbi:ComF family protein [Staphylococcus felis]|uniref:ComF family protein n=2 Tax=Staphylococcus felis TaxID=46127 RepID=A0A2K3Z2I5_9STAP|nr:ComF family protein [Staphylococcus felis]PNZ32076.1 ComF family protein [Staphylococcus felis]QQB04494.1 ComF family protein [Staphylococcus felis]REH77818.1 ComF family protein [Staphylococcus felis]REH84407.1 ComF family protein [Staphylococcus felis]
MINCLICHSRIREQLNMHNAFTPPEILCEKCLNLLERLKFIEEGRCTYCKGSLEHSICKNCSQKPENTNIFECITPIFHYDGIIKSLIHQYKFMKDVALGHIFARYISVPRQNYDYIVPIPSAEDNDFERTFNPVTTILDLKKINYLKCLGMVKRPKQYQLSQYERRISQNPMYFKGEINLQNKHILLIDDIYTTGETAHHAARILFSKKVRKLNMLTFAR